MGRWRGRAGGALRLAAVAAGAGLAAGAVGGALLGFPPSRPVTDATFAALAARTLPAVATVYTTIPGQVRLTRQGASVTPAARGIGSGVLVDRSGLVLTNDHVVAGASAVRVKVRGEARAANAGIVATDYALDLALLRIPAPRDVAPLNLSRAAQPRVGAWVQAIGNPEGLASTVTVGVVSAQHRAFTIGGRHYKDLVQTDAAINPGNSGGPLLDLAGRVVGINTAVVTHAYGLGFAIPSAAVERELPVLERQHLKAAGWLGVDVASLTPALRAQAHAAATTGAFVLAVLPGSPAEVGGIRAGDVIQKVSGHPVADARSLVRLVSSRPPRSHVAIDVARGTAQLELRGVLGQVPTKAA